MNKHNLNNHMVLAFRGLPKNQNPKTMLIFSAVWPTKGQHLTQGGYLAKSTGKVLCCVVLHRIFLPFPPTPMC